MLTWIKDFDKFEARFKQFGGWIHIPEHTRSAFWVCSQQSEVQKKALFDVRPSINGQKNG